VGNLASWNGRESFILAVINQFSPFEWNQNRFQKQLRDCAEQIFLVFQSRVNFKAFIAFLYHNLGEAKESIHAMLQRGKSPFSDCILCGHGWFWSSVYFHCLPDEIRRTVHSARWIPPQMLALRKTMDD
jgi:hypothetical protein